MIGPTKTWADYAADRRRERLGAIAVGVFLAVALTVVTVSLALLS